MVFNNKVVIVTGSSSGIGAAIALQFANLSANVVIIGRNEEKLKIVAKQCESEKGIKPLVVQADLNKDSDVENIVNQTLKRFGKIDVLVNNAGVGATAGLRDGIEHFDNIISTNLRSVYLLTSLVVPHLIKTKGNIVSVSSVAAKKPVPEFLPYCISKAGLDMFTKCVAKELAADGVRVNSVNPGPVRTNFQTAAGMNQDQIDNFFKDRETRSPLGKIATSEEIADLIAYVASDRASSITGSIYFVDNGLLLA